MEGWGGMGKEQTLVVAAGVKRGLELEPWEAARTESRVWSCWAPRARVGAGGRGEGVQDEGEERLSWEVQTFRAEPRV